ncbi:hypothetical protein [Microbacterium lushaniae]|uniref:Uncharacterized protein n=1 Tax=Microbacterium lushaniae TaxID=2614639 RepID=A0A5J6L2G7_9MICO|nr:hypothetical protein [Microbacterium lushaniae]QEW02773.1 hypothetical protein F6J85_06420 [Microbacterium lushaniae]
MGVAGGVAAVVLDLGWVVWVLSLAAVGLAVLCALSGTRRSALIGLVAGAAVVAGGCLAVDGRPPVPQGWQVLPDISPSEDVDDYWEVGGTDDVRVLAERDRNALVGYSDDGSVLWVNDDVAEVEGWSAVSAGDSVVAFAAGTSDGPAMSIATATGETEWSAEVDGAEPFSANADVIVFTDGERTLAVDRRSGERVWETAGSAIASSEGRSSFNPQRWTPEADWIVVSVDDADRYAVVDTRTGETAITAQLGEYGEWVIAGDTLVTFGYEDDRPVAVGIPLAGGAGWTTEITGGDRPESYQPADADVRLVNRASVQWLDGSDGELTTFDLPTGWTVDDTGGDTDGARGLVAQHRDRDGDSVAIGLLDPRTGDLIPMDQRVAGAQVTGATASGTIVEVTYRDAVGGTHERTVLIPDAALSP